MEWFSKTYQNALIGEIHNRKMWNHDLSYMHKIWFMKKMELQLLGGINVRTGGEYLLGIKTNTGGVLLGQKLEDVGVLIGLNASYSVLKHWVLSFQPTYTRYIYRYYKRNPNISFDKGTSKNMLRLSFGLGYQFGNGRKTKE